MSLSLKGISKTYPGGERAVRNFSLDIEENELLVLAGPSGSGKTTLLRMIAGLEDITAGTLLIDDKEVTDAPVKDRNVAMYFQNGGISPNASVYENLAHGLKLRKYPPEVIKERVDAMAKLLGFTEQLQKMPKLLSGAMRVRLALGRVLVREAPLLLDEPFTNLDPTLRAQMNAELIKLQARVRLPFIYTTCDRAEAMSVGSRVAVMKDGFLQQVDTPRNLYDYPANLFVADFIGGADFARGGRLLREGAQFALTFEEQRVVLPEKLVSRFTEIEKYADTGREVIVAFHPEDVSGECGFDLMRTLLFDGETERTLLARDGGYIATSANKQAELIPPTPQEMAQRKEDAPKKRRK